MAQSQLSRHELVGYKQPVGEHLKFLIYAGARPVACFAWSSSGMLSREWERVYGHPIHFVKTFIDPERFPGTCYRAVNWMVLGCTTGRGKNAWSKRPNRPIKEVLGYPLTPRFRQLLAEV